MKQHEIEENEEPSKFSDSKRNRQAPVEKKQAHLKPFETAQSAALSPRLTHDTQTEELQRRGFLTPLTELQESNFGSEQEA